MTDSLLLRREPPVLTVTIDRPHARNALDKATAAALGDAVRAFEADEEIAVAVLTGADGAFCAGADLKELSGGADYRAWAGSPEGPLRRPPAKPVIAAVAGHAVAGGLGLALWCDIRIADETAVFGVFCRRWGVPMSDGTTVRLPRIVGLGRALDMLITGRPVDAAEALSMGLVSRVVPAGRAVAEAEALARAIAAFPPLAMLSDRQSALTQFDRPLDAALMQEAALAEAAKRREAAAGAARFAAGASRHGRVEETDHTEEAAS